ncbi:MAG: hypothetical protein Kow0059_13730 [Candidatus Sumerlaeia bacterium]
MNSQWAEMRGMTEAGECATRAGRQWRAAAALWGIWLVSILAAAAGNGGAAISRDAWSKLSADLRRRVDVRDAGDRPILVTVVAGADAPVPAVLERAVSGRPIGPIRHFVGQIRPSRLLKLASQPGVLSVFSEDTFQTALMKPDGDGPPRAALRSDPLLRRTALEQGKTAALKQAGERIPLPQRPHGPEGSIGGAATLRPAAGPLSSARQLLSPRSADIHNAQAAWSSGWTGKGVTVAVVDTGVDFCNPDLQGRQARVAGGAYDGWPFAFDPVSSYYYATEPALTIGPDTYWDYVTDTYFCHTLPVEGVTCSGGQCSADLKVDFGSDVGWPWAPVTLPFTWPDTSRSGNYRYSIHPDYILFLIGYFWSLGYAGTDLVPPAVIVSDETTPGVYDTVYVDTDFDQSFLDEKPMRRGDELAGADLVTAQNLWGTDGLWDLSAGMLGWISDGEHLPPGLTALYTSPLPAAPAPGELLVFICDGDGHGTNCSSMVAGRAVMEDPFGLGPINPLFAGAAGIGGAGGPVVRGMAPGAAVAAFVRGFDLPLDSWALCVLGFDGAPNTGDEVQIVSNSWGDSDIVEDGWDAVSRYPAYINRFLSDRISFLSSTGNGGPGYGTMTRPSGNSFISVGASTSFGELSTFERATADRFTWGDVIPFSNRGPGMSGASGPDVVAVGAFGTACYPLNLFGNGQAAYSDFGGTSMSCPIAAGVLALVYEAFHQTRGRWPSWEEARVFLMQGAHDLYYDVLTQGAGLVDAGASTAIAAGETYRVEPAEWLAGGFRGRAFPAFPAELRAGQATSTTITITNPTAQPLDLELEAVELLQTGYTFHTFNSPANTPVASFTSPTILLDITSQIATRDPDLVRAQFAFKYTLFDPEEDYIYNMRWRILFYDWTDLNHDGILWNDGNLNGQVDDNEIQGDPVTGQPEYNRFTYGYPSGTMIEASVGRDSLSRRHDGVFLGFQRRTGNAAAELRGRVTYYSWTPWSWVGLSPVTLNIPPGGSAIVVATLAIPPDTRPGIYQGALRVKSGGGHRVIPIVTHVAPLSANFAFGAENPFAPVEDRLPDNKHVFGGFDWSWRYESGDWRVVYFDAPEDSATLGRHLFVDVDFLYDKSDVDVFVFGPDPDDPSALNDPLFFGPYGEQRLGGSVDTYLGGGTFKRFTNTGGSREVIAGPLTWGGLHFVALHHVLFGDNSFGEPYVGRVWTATVQPLPIEGRGPSGSIPASFTSDVDISEGISVEAFGLTQPVTMRNLPIKQDNQADYCDTPSQIIPIDIAHCAVLEVSTGSQTAVDIDLFVLKDDGDGTPECGGDDALMAHSTTPAADEFVSLIRPADGRYWAIIHGYEVPGPGQTCSVVVRALQGTGLSVPVPPAGAVTAGTPVTFDVNWNGLSGPGQWEGALLIGPSYAPGALMIPVTVWMPVAADAWMLR